MIFKIILMIIFLIVNWGDYGLTKTILSKGGQELNPIIRTVGLLPVKIAMTPIVLVLGYVLSWPCLVIIDAALLGACVWNAIQLGRM